MPGGLNSFSDNLRSMAGQPSVSGEANRSNRIIYPAIVRDIEDKSKKNRLKVEIVSIDEQGNIKGGRDNNIPLDRLPICVPLLPEFLHVRPQIGECVYVISENPTDLSSPRFWIGPVITSQLKMNFEGYAEAQGVFNSSSFKSGEIYDKASTNSSNSKIETIIPQQGEVAVQGREDADVTFKNREVIIRAGKLVKGELDINETHPCRVQLKQVENEGESEGALSQFIVNSNFQPFSQINIEATNINLISTEGKNRNPESQNIETNTNRQNLERYGGITKELHPVVFGDELITLLKVMINFMLTHIHTPQGTAVHPLEDIGKLSLYRTDQKMQDLISKNIRVN